MKVSLINEPGKAVVVKFEIEVLIALKITG